MVGTIIIILLALFLLGLIGRLVTRTYPRTGSWLHTLLVIAVILISLALFGMI